jgi:hypothetical protein
MDSLSVFGCSNAIMAMDIDVYYGDSEQDDYGRENNTWTFDQTLTGYIEILGAVSQDALKVGTFFEYKDKLIGRAESDPRINSAGVAYPITSILITNIRDKKSQVPFYNEVYGERAGLPSLYEVFAIEPYVNPWNQIEYWKIMLNRSETQGLIEP